VLHKTEVGGVRLGVRTVDEMDVAFAAIGSDTVLVERMAPDGVDLVVGARRDPVFGPIVLVGLGGTVAEALADVAVRVAPAADAAAMAGELAGRALLDGWRGGPVLDPVALARVVDALGGLLLAHPHLEDVEINPLRLTAGGLVALDAVIMASDPTEADVAQPHR
jgi:acetate---CoA ligase (ADP-forming)